MVRPTFVGDDMTCSLWKQRGGKASTGSRVPIKLFFQQINKKIHIGGECMTTDIKSGIYCIENMINHKRYFGQSVNIDKRLKKHKYLLKNNRHYNEHLQNAYNTYGDIAFNFYAVEYCATELLDERECYYIAANHTTEREYGYNLESGGVACTSASEETKEKLRQANLGKIMSEETKQKISAANKGMKMPDSQRLKLKELHTGLRHSDEAKDKIRKYRSTPVYCIELGCGFDSIKDAAEQCKIYGAYQNGISLCLRDEREYCGKHPITKEPLTWQILKE